MKRSILRLPKPPPEKPPQLLPRSALVVPISIEEPAYQIWAEEVRLHLEDLRGEILPDDQLWTHKTGPIQVEEGIALERKRRIIAKAMVRRRHVAHSRRCCG